MPTSARTESFTTRLRADARDGAELLGKATSFIENELPQLRSDLLEVIETQGSVEAQQALMKINDALRNLGAVAAKPVR